ncbi:hypothetical protein [Shimia sagamensis]|uniref:DUF1795 domain-containing protein n=1 Tax=Shimia sagamensis TaxID=1566352 RepID=A0ABY1PIE5_9RHOB|nr:hypothetical protein [Shimia sagamensis]SMP35107.1 hypothetical protein SAMN06265373_11120 [Shimia sagamensis]
MQKTLRLVGLLLSAVLCAASSLALAGTQVAYSDQTRNVFQVDVPDFWNLRVGGPRDLAPSNDDDIRAVERVFGLEPESDHGVWVGLISPQKFRTLEDAKEYARGLSGQLAKTTEILTAEDRRVGNYPATVITGTGRRDGKPVSFNVTLLDIQNGRVVVALTIMSQGFDQSALTDVNAILQSIKAR